MIRRVEICAGPGGVLSERVAVGLRVRGWTVEIVARPSASSTWVDLAIERSTDGILPPAAFDAGGDGIAISSLLAYHPNERHIGMAPERWGPAPAGSVAAAWRAFEATSSGPRTAILRAAPCPVAGGQDAFSRWLGGRVVASAFGFDPCLQLLHPDDLIAALAWALGDGRDATRGALTNVVPSQPVFVRQAIAAAGKIRIALPSATLRRGALGLGAAADALRFPITARGERATSHGWQASRTSRQAAAAFGWRQVSSDEGDPFGLDARYISRFEKTLFRFLHDAYWRVEYRGAEHLPAQGGGVLVGVHRGFMPWDGVMMLVGCHRHTRRFLRFLVHPALVKLPLLAPYMTKIGGIVACQENADWMLERGELLGVFPEGIRGAFRRYRDWHRIGRFVSDDFVRFALRHQVPIIPFATVGSAEIFPIWGKIKASWWRRYAEWPFIPITTPIPLPSKWHTEILPPIDPAARYGPEAASDAAIVKQISLEVRGQLQASIDRMREARRSLFSGKLFEEAS